MSLSGTRLQSSLAADFLAQIQAKFPIPSTLLAAEKTALQGAQTNLANAMAAAAGPDVVTEVKNASVSTTDTGTVTSGAGSGGTVAATGTGTVT